MRQLKTLDPTDVAAASAVGEAVINTVGPTAAHWAEAYFSDMRSAKPRRPGFGASNIARLPARCAD